MFEFESFSAFGFSGSRSSVPAPCAGVASRVPAGAAVFVGCAAGVDRFFRSQFPGAVGHGSWGSLLGFLPLWFALWLGVPVSRRWLGSGLALCRPFVSAVVCLAGVLQPLESRPSPPATP